MTSEQLTSGTSGRQQSYRERSKKKRLDVKNGVTLEKLLENHKACNFFVERKSRFCGLSKTPGSNFCGIHRAEVGETTLLSRAEKETARIEGTTTLERTCCPQCGDSLFKRALEKHLGICNVSTTERELKKKPYYRENCNAFLSSSILSKLDAGKGMSSVDPDALLRKVEECFNCYVKLDKSTFLKSPELTAEEEQVMCEVGGEQSSQNKLRHARQDALIVRQVQKVISSSPGEKGTNAKKNVYIEMGAGAGALGYACHCADPAAHIVFVERAPTGKKCLDRTLRRQKLEHKFYRARMDIRHCLISALPGVADVGVKGGGGGKVVVIAKHLCGSASDLAINSLHGGNEEDGQGQVAAGGNFKAGSGLNPGQVAAPEPTQRQTCELQQEQKGLVVATCCHHRCEWDDYVGQQWLTDRDFTPQEFEVLTHWSGWGTGLSAWWSGIRSSRRGQEVLADEGESNDIKRRKVGGLDGGDGDNDNDKEDEEGNEEGNEEENEGEDDNEHQYKPSLKGFPRPAGITKEAMALAGFKTKRILDQGRCEALRTAGYNAKQVQFCSPKDSPECYCIVTS